MSQTFGAAAARLFHAAAMLLCWRPDEFWSATPMELATALTPPVETGGAPEPDLIAQLRERFPDE